MYMSMIIDLVMGVTALMIGLWLGVCSGPLADHLQEGDERYREEHPWVETFEPQVGFLATADRPLVDPPRLAAGSPPSASWASARALALRGLLAL